MEAFSCYSTYIECYSETVGSYNESKKNANFVEYLESCNEKARKVLTQVDCRIRLEDLMIMPVQRIPRYLLFLREMIKYTDSSNHLQSRLCQCLGELEEVVSGIDRIRAEREVMLRLSEIVRLVRMPHKNNFVRNLLTPSSTPVNLVHRLSLNLKIARLFVMER